MSQDPAHPQPVFQAFGRPAQASYSRGEYVRRFAWLVVQATLFRLSLPRAYGWRRFLLRRFGARLAPHAAIARTARIIHPWLLEMGDWTLLAPGATVYNLGPISIGSQTVISQDAYLCAGTHDYTKPDLPLLKPPIRIGAGAWIAAGAFIGPGVTIGDNSVIGARAVVVSDIPPNVVAAGNPCRVIKPRPMPQPA